MRDHAVLGSVGTSVGPTMRSSAARVLLPTGWLAASIGYYGPWIDHVTAALTLSGVDMGEFVKFLPGVMDGSLAITRQLFYLPPLAVVVSVAMLVGSRHLRFPWFERMPMLFLAVLMSLQLLPPAWSPSSLLSPEFRLQAIALGVCWLLLTSFWLLGHLSFQITASVSAALSMAAVGLVGWQILLAKPEIDRVYGLRVPVGWGFLLCMAGLTVVAAASLIAVPGARTRSRGS